MQIGVLGINHKLACLDLRDAFAKVSERRFHPRFSAHGDHTFILLSTCNRTEIYFSSDDLSETHSYLLSILRQELSEDFDQKLYSFFGHECFYHLSRVTVGLDSACVAETEIQGQVKTAYETALMSRKLPPEIHYLFQKALTIGKQIRTELNLGVGIKGLDSAVLTTGRHFFYSRPEPRILFIGGSSINEKILAKRELPGAFLMTRSPSRGAELQEKYGIVPLAWDPEMWTDFDWILTGSKTTQYLIEPKKVDAKKLVMDLSVPRNVNPLLGKNPNITLMNIDQLNRLLATGERRLHEALIEADTLIQERSRRHVALYQEKRKRSTLLALAG
jgi:glutamyl-tRNA reductase